MNIAESAQVRRQGFDGIYVLVDAPSRTPVAMGEEVCSQNGSGLVTAYKLEGGRPPQHENSSGKIWVRESPDHVQREFYARVCNLVWIREDLL